MTDPGNDFAALTETAWREFRIALANRLDDLAHGEHVEVRLDTGETDGCPPTLRLTRLGDELELTVVGNRLLADPWRMGKAARRRLRDLGLTGPTSDRPHFACTWPATHVDQAAAVAVAALRESLGVAHPALLVSTDWTALQPPPRQAPYATFPSDRAQLDMLIDAALAPVLGVPHRDADADIPVQAGKTTVYVRSHDDVPLISLFAKVPIVVSDQAHALVVANFLNLHTASVKFTVTDGEILAYAEVVAFPFCAEQLRSLLGRVCEVIGRLEALPAPPADPVNLPAGPADARVEPMMQCVRMLERVEPLRPKSVARLCNHDAELLREMIHWSEHQELTWRQARDDAADATLARACERERVHARNTLKVLRKALRRSLHH